jgi:integral membrane protein
LEFEVLNTPLGRLRVIGYCEGVSFLVLLGIAMPLKYAAGMPEAVLITGWIHGVLFIAYVIAAVQAASANRWPHGRLALAFAAAVLPFGPFVFDWWLRRVNQPAPRQSPEKPLGP